MPNGCKRPVANFPSTFFYRSGVNKVGPFLEWDTWMPLMLLTAALSLRPCVKKADYHGIWIIDFHHLHEPLPDGRMEFSQAKLCIYWNRGCSQLCAKRKAPFKILHYWSAGKVCLEHSTPCMDISTPGQTGTPPFTTSLLCSNDD